MIDVDWVDTDSKYSVAESDEMSLSDALSVTCRECDRGMTWVLEPDPDSLCYRAECDECAYVYSIRPTKARIVQIEAGL